MIGENNDLEWIIDTRASHHIAKVLSALHYVRVITGCPVSLPNGHILLLPLNKGMCILLKNLMLRDVLFVPEFSFNLIFVSHLVSDNACIIQFTPSLCAI